MIINHMDTEQRKRVEKKLLEFFSILHFNERIKAFCKHMRTHDSQTQRVVKHVGHAEIKGKPKMIIFE